MIVKAKNWMIGNGYGAWAAWPFIVIRDPTDLGLVAHETIHYNEQRRWLTLPWLLSYFVSTTFRINAEVRAHKAEIAYGELTLDAAAVSLMRYSKTLSKEDAMHRLQEP